MCSMQRGGAQRVMNVRVQVAIDFMDAIRGAKRQLDLGGVGGMPAGKSVEVDIPAGAPAPANPPPPAEHARHRRSLRADTLAASSGR